MPGHPFAPLAILLAAASLGAQAPLAESRARALGQLDALRAEQGLDGRHAFRVRSAERDELGQTHVRVQQLFQGVRVWGGEAIAHLDAEGQALAPTLSLRRGIGIQVQPTLPEAEVRALVLADLGAPAGWMQAPALELVVYPRTLRRPRAARAGAAPANAEDFETGVQEYRLAYHVHAEIEQPGDTRHTDYLIDAHSGAILETWDSLQTASAVGTGNSQYSGTVQLTTNPIAGGFELRDLLRPASSGNTVNNLNHATDGAGTVYTDADDAWGDGLNYKGGAEPTTSANGQTAAVDAAYGIQSAWDMYRNVLGRNGIDGQGGPVYARVHYDTGYDNAFYSDTCHCLTYGDGTKRLVYTALDIAAHEYSHGVCAATAGLVYSKESGGLNESNSDIMGVMTEFYARGARGQGGVIPDTGGNWTQGEQIATAASPYYRVMYKPSLDTKSADEWSPTLASLDVHYSSGPMNRCFYFLSQGATTGGDTSTPRLPQGMAGIGNQKAARIWYRALTTYFTSTTDYAAARIACINAARDLYAASSPEEIAVWNAFAGINVGGPWAGPDAAPTVTVSESGSKGTLAFSATASDDKGVAKVEFLVDGAVVGTFAAPPYAMTFDSLMQDDGTHTLAARATDTAGLYGAATMNFLIDNGQLIKNASFERGYGVGWSNTSGMQIGAILNTPAYDGSKCAKFCGSGSAMSVALFQTVTIPAAVSTATLGYALRVETKETSSLPHDTFTVQLRSTSGQVLANLATYSNVDAGAAWRLLNHDVSAFRGQTVQVYFQGTEDSAIATGFLLDRVHLDVAGSSTPAVTVSISPASATLVAGGSQQFTASVTGTANTAVGWSASAGTVSATGLYTAPATAGAWSVKATSAADPSKSATATVTVTTAPVVSVAISPASATLAPGASQQFTASVTGSANTTVGWSASAGTVSATGLYTAPATAGTCTVQATSAADPSKSATATVTVQAAPAGGELLVNGGFESGYGVGWSNTSGVQIGAILGQTPFEGSRCAKLCGVGAANSQALYQAASIPAAAAGCSLGFALHIETRETTSLTAYDTLKVQLRDPNGALLATLATFSNLNAAAGWKTFSYDVSAYRGRTVQVYFLGAEDSAVATSFVLDKVSLATR